MITWRDSSYLKITSDDTPHTAVIKPLPSDTDEEKKEKKAKPYLNKTRIMWDVNYLGKQYCFVIEKGYRWNGANIPRCFWCLIGSMGESDFLDASMVHDKMCENHDIIGNDRQLSSMVFREILKGAGVSNLKANIMYLAVDKFQKYFGKWECLK